MKFEGLTIVLAVSLFPVRQTVDVAFCQEASVTESQVVGPEHRAESSLDSEKASLKDREARLLSEFTQRRSTAPNQADSNRQVNSEQAEAVNDRTVSQMELNALKERYEKLAAKVVTQVDAIEALKTTNSDLQKKLTEANDQAQKLQKKLENSINRLMLAETEVDRLSSIIDERNKSALATIRRGTLTRSADTESLARANIKSVPSAPLVRAEAEATDMPVVTVIVDKAQLRADAGEENSALMAVSRGSKLVVETTKGQWLRVLTPNNSRAWIRRDMVAFGAGANLSLTDPARVKGFIGDGANTNSNSDS